MAPISVAVAIDRAAPQARAQRAHRPAFGDDPLDDAVRVLLDDAERHAARLEKAREHVGGKARLLLVEVHRDDLERERRAPLERQQDVEQAIAVLAAGHADHHAVVRRDQVVRADRLADQPAQALPELVGLELGLPRDRRRTRAGRPRAGPTAADPESVGGRGVHGPVILPAGRGIGAKIGPFPAAPTRETPMQTILVANPKGGSGKTTLATNVAGWLAGKRQDVVLRDLDPQRSSTEWLERRPALFPRIAGLAARCEARPQGSRSRLACRRYAGRIARRRLARCRSARRRDARAVDAVGVRHGGGSAFSGGDPGAEGDQERRARARHRRDARRSAHA